MNSEPTDFLYPFIDSQERDSASLVTDLVASAKSKMDLSTSLRTSSIQRLQPQLQQAASSMAERFARGGRLFTFGNGGSATDAEGSVELFRHPPFGRPLPALSLVDDRAVLTALANDVGFELVFSRQLIAHGNPTDMAMGFSTSGDSANILRGFEEADRRGMLTVGFAGYTGGAMATSDHVHHCFVVDSDSVHRIQEAQDALLFALWSQLQAAMDQT